MRLLILLFSFCKAFKPRFAKDKKINAPLPTPEAIPISIGLGQMTKSADVQCTESTCPTKDKLTEDDYDLNSPQLYRCGIKCHTSTGTFDYNFKGVKFGIIGTASSEFFSFTVELDGNEIDVNPYRETLEEYSLLYVSDDLDDIEHSIKIKGKGQKYELYKLVYWPSLTAKRLNSTDFESHEGTWYTQSDGIGGVRQYTAKDSTKDTISSTLPFSKIWVYGTKCSWCGSFDMKVGDYEKNLNLKEGSTGQRFDSILLYESENFVGDNYSINFETETGATINFIYYIEEEISTPKPTPEVIPISIGLNQMTKSDDFTCSSNTCPTSDRLNEDDYDLNSPDFYRCGIHCSTNDGTIEYKFKGVKFGIIGDSSPESYSFDIEFDNNAAKEINTHKMTRNKYSLLYVSDDLDDIEHSIKIKGKGQKYELYKLVYWPSLTAKRLNSTDFESHEGTWYTQSDGIGGVRQYTAKDSTKDTISSTIWASHIWIYGTKCQWCGSFDLSINDFETNLNLKQGEKDQRFDTILLYEKRDLITNWYNFSLSSEAGATFNFIYYIEPQPIPADEIIKNEKDCDNNKRCKHEQIKDAPVNVYINVTEFSNLNDAVNGAAIYITNAGLQCNHSKFTNCIAQESIGGAIYLKNELNHLSNVANLEKLEFTGCKAKCGGAAYIYSSSELNVVTIINCIFKENAALGKTTDDHFGGSAIYLIAFRGILERNSFRRNSGVGGTTRIINIFEYKANNKLMILENEKQPSLVISKCLFDIHSGSDCSLFYVAGKHGSLVELKDSTFIGDLPPKSHYISGTMIDKEAPKLLVNNCKFASDSKKSINSISILNMNMKNQVFNYNIDGTNNKNKNENALVLSFLVSVCALIVLGIVMYIVKKKNIEENETQSEPLDSSLQNTDPLI